MYHPVTLISFLMYDCWVQVRPSSAHDSPFFTTNSGAPVWNNNSSLTVGTRGASLFILSISNTNKQLLQTCELVVVRNVLEASNV